MKYLIQTLITLLFFCTATFSSHAQHTIFGTVTTEEADPIVGANIVLTNTFGGTVTDENGQFRLENLRAGTYQIKISFIGFQTYKKEIELIEDIELRVALPIAEILSDEVIVASTRASKNTATTYSELNKEAIESLNLGQDVPFLLQQTPSTVINSDAGAGVGYTGIRIRGTDATRINVTINGIPLNDPESHGVFWVNLPDLGSSIDNIQIQRGVGTSTNGAGAFGGSINVLTGKLNKDAYGETNHTFGSFNTRKHNVAFGSGLLSDKFVIEGRLSKITSDGYVDRASSDLDSWFMSAAYYGKNTLLRFNAFAGREVTYQSWYGIDEFQLENDRTANFYTYENEVDNYGQDHYQLYFAQALSPNLNFNLAGHFTHGEGYFEQFKDGEDLADYGLENTSVFEEVDGAMVLVEETDLIRRKWLDNDFYGFTSSFNYRKDRLNATLGGAWNSYEGDHFGEVIWAQFMGNGNLGHRFYDNVGDKKEFNVYLKSELQHSDKLNTFIDLQYRNINYAVEGIDEDQGNVRFQKDFSFFNPKIGLNYQLDKRSNFYASFAIAHREPTRSNIIDNAIEPVAEELQNVELGYQYQGNRAAFNANVYVMNYKDQLVPTGNLNDVGATIQENVAKSYRHGIELSGGIQLSSQLKWEANLTLGTSNILEFDQSTSIFTDDVNWGYVGDTTITYTNTEIAFSPNIIAASTLTYSPAKNLDFRLLSKYVGDQFLDNTANENRKLDAFFVNHLQLEYTLKDVIFKEIGFNLLVNNVFNVLYEPNGYTYFILFGENNPAPTNYNFYYPQAGTNFLMGVKVRF
ncbi:MAG: TonB-dependent receptor [Chitinophagales bacterium]